MSKRFDRIKLNNPRGLFNIYKHILNDIDKELKNINITTETKPFKDIDTDNLELLSLTIVKFIIDNVNEYFKNQGYPNAMTVLILGDETGINFIKENHDYILDKLDVSIEEKIIFYTHTTDVNEAIANLPYINYLEILKKDMDGDNTLDINNLNLFVDNVIIKELSKTLSNLSYWDILKPIMETYILDRVKNLNVYNMLKNNFIRYYNEIKSNS